MPDIATAADLATFLGGEEVYQEQADQWLEGAEAAVRSFCQWRVTAGPDTFVVDGTPQVAVLLPTKHLTAVTAVTVDGVELDPSAYQWSQAGVLLRGGGWPALARGVVVECVHGYDPVPAEVKLVVLAVAARGLLNPGSLRSEGLGGHPVAHAGGPAELLPGEERVLARHCL